jgi:hypothetical protein
MINNLAIGRDMDQRARGKGVATKHANPQPRSAGILDITGSTF